MLGQMKVGEALAKVKDSQDSPGKSLKINSTQQEIYQGLCLSLYQHWEARMRENSQEA